MHGLRPFAVPVDHQVKGCPRLADKGDELLAAAVRIEGVVVVHQGQVTLRGQRAGFFLQNHHRRFGFLGLGDTLAPISKGGERHADAQHR